MNESFFQTGRTYTHVTEDGDASGEGVFLVEFVGRAPAPFEHHSETGGVAFGWKWGMGPDCAWEGNGAYVTPDFAGWVEIPLPPCGATAGGGRWVCAVAELRPHRHVAANGDYWDDPERCGHDHYDRLECDEVPTVRCGAVGADGKRCLFIAAHKRGHDFVL